MPAEKILAIETSSQRLSLAVGNEKRILATYLGPLEWRHAEGLFKGMLSLLSRQHWGPADLTGVAVSVGPGSFTGIRIGLAAARTLGQVLRIPVVGVSSLEVMAMGAPVDAHWLCPRIDAFRGQIFSALFERTASGKLVRVLPETMAPGEEWLRDVKLRVKGRKLWVGSLTGGCPAARELLDLARSRLAKAGRESYKRVLPLYIRQAAAIERRVGQR